ncbi:phosphatase PAP2 family protein [Myroides sp. WP-1]|uniref:phosphatase PAP2 family protein n=1 Tax=Myroides sp. WP-1 TaxID=2759944 RepID=UPI0015F79B92|nr:phosphatase PAP2 family protein [Myroides sp. WP-1]MBB1137906.1 phosphatase PAP2 family protein [Myroides sp. WP-1]
MNKFISISSIKPRYFTFAFPLGLLLCIFFLLYLFDSLSIKGYIHLQKEWFYFINHYVSQHPELLFNLTQFGDALIFLSFLTLFILYTPKLWESLLTGSLISMVVALLLKELFAIPRPAKAFDYKTFHIIGEKLSGSTSFPSGHSITIFTILTILMFVFAPKRKSYKISYVITTVSIGLLFAFTRVAVGAHYPLDVFIGCVLGYISGLLGLCITHKYRLWPWIYNKKYYPLFLLLFLSCCIVLIWRILQENLFIYYCALGSLCYSSYKITKIYVQK